MKRKNITILLLAVLLAGCNFPSPTSTGTAPEIQTAAAQTVQAVLATPAISPTAPPPAVTQSTAPVLTVTDNTNCRSGPGTNYKVVTVLAGGTSVPVVARYPDGTYWVVDPPSNENCWVANEFATISGNTSSLPQVTPVAEAGDSGAPARPGSLFYNYSCSGGTVTTTLSWKDAADNENGYRVYRNDTVIADLPANSSQYVDEVSGGGSTKWYFKVEAYNNAGASQPRTADFSCQ